MRGPLEHSNELRVPYKQGTYWHLDIANLWRNNMPNVVYLPVRFREISQTLFQ